MICCNIALKMHPQSSKVTLQPAQGRQFKSVLEELTELAQRVAIWEEEHCLKTNLDCKQSKWVSIGKCAHPTHFITYSSVCW